ncbi:hypothetical protein HDV06_003606, partial [Boothiomyces sp. JEL0866]
MTEDIGPTQIELLNLLNPTLINVSKIPVELLDQINVERMPKLKELKLQKVIGNASDFITRLANTFVSHLTLRGAVYDLDLRFTTITHLNLSNNKL